MIHSLKHKLLMALSGARDTLPLVLAAVPFGILFGALCQAFGLPFMLCIAMSVFVFAGSSQFVAVNLLGMGTPWFVVVCATFVVNLRHMMYSASLMKHVRQYSWLKRAVLAFGLTDETYATVLNRLNQQGLNQQDSQDFCQHYYLGSFVFMYSNWILCSGLGFLVGAQLKDPLGWGLDVAMVVAFIGIVTPLLKSKRMWLCAVLSGGVAVLTHDLPFQMSILVSSVVAIVIPTWLTFRAKQTTTSLQPEAIQE